jgi:hypothetical protein
MAKKTKTPTVETQTPQEAENAYLGSKEERSAKKAPKTDMLLDPEVDALAGVPAINEPDGSGMVVRLRKAVLYAVENSKDSKIANMAGMLDTVQKQRIMCSLVGRVLAHKCDDGCCDKVVLGDIMSDTDVILFEEIGLSAEDCCKFCSVIAPEIRKMGVDT